MSSDEAEADDRRRESRAPIELRVEYKRLNTFFADYTKNISRGGTFIKTDKPLPVGTEFLFQLVIPNLDKPLSIHGHVQRTISTTDAAATGAEAGMAIRFIYREGDSRDTISVAVERLMSDSLGNQLYAKLMEQARTRGGGTE